MNDRINELKILEDAVFSCKENLNLETGKLCFSKFKSLEDSIFFILTLKTNEEMIRNKYNVIVDSLKITDVNYIKKINSKDARFYAKKLAKMKTLYCLFYQ